MNILNRHNTLSTIISIVLCILFILQIANRTVYFHSHKLENGQIISHAHPYNKSSDSTPFKKHHHSDNEIIILAQLEVLLLLSFVLFALFIVSQYKHYVKQSIKRYSLGLLPGVPGRSPPIVL